MTTDVRTFKAANMQEALDLVRREMGQEAVVLHTRHIEKKRLWPWSPRRQEIEVTAGLGDQVRQPIRTTSGTIAAQTIAAPARIPESRPATDSELAPPPDLLSSANLLSSVKTPQVTESKSSGSGPRNTVVPPKWSPRDVIRDDAPVSVPTARRTPASPSSTRSVPKPRLASDRLETPHSVPLLNRSPEVRTIAARSRMAAPPENTNDPASIHQRLDSLQQMILELGRERRHASLLDIPTELFQVYTSLIDAEMEEATARELVLKVHQVATPSQLASRAAVQGLIAAQVEQELRISPPITGTRGRRKVVALIGPTGVGKTTTLAKLAANARLRDGLRVGLVTIDTYRIAAVEQLRTYAEIMDLPMKVVTSPEEMRRALKELEGLDLVLIDTAGRSPRDDERLQELRQCLDAAQADEVMLVLSLASGSAGLEAVANNFRPVGVTSLIMTKLDEATSPAGLLQVSRQLRMPVSYLTTGQNVPDDIEQAHRTRMTRLILGEETVAT